MKKDCVPALRDVAAKAGVSISTVSRAMRNSPLVPKALTTRIQRIARQIGYHHDPKMTELMAHLRKGRRRPARESLAYVFSMDYSSYQRFGEASLAPKLPEMHNRAAELGFRLEVFHLGDYRYNGARLGKVLWNRGIRGVVVDMLRLEDARLDLGWHHFSAVAFGFSLNVPILHRICHHYFHSVRLACESLRRIGYRRIGLAINLRADHVSDHNWVAGYLYENFRESIDNPPPPCLGVDPESGEFERWLKTAQPDVVLISGLAEPYLRALKRFGLRVPEDIGLATLHRREEDPQPAGIEQRIALQGRISISILAALIAQHETGVPVDPVIHQVEGTWHDGKTLRRKRPPRRRRNTPSSFQ